MINKLQGFSWSYRPTAPRKHDTAQAAAYLGQAVVFLYKARLRAVHAVEGFGLRKLLAGLGLQLVLKPIPYTLVVPFLYVSYTPEHSLFPKLPKP